jgi:hypothetical protein
MSGKRARAQRRLHDPRTYQGVLMGAMEWDALAPGKCSECGKVDPAHRRCRWTTFDSGLVANYVARPGESDNAHADRTYREMNARQREGDFTPVLPPRAFGLDCGIGVARLFSEAGSAYPADQLVATVMVSLVVGQHPRTAFMVTAEPGAEGHWRMSCVSAAYPYDPDRLYQAVRRRTDAGQNDVREPPHAHWTLVGLDRPA